MARHRFVLALGVVTLAVLSPLASGEEPPAPAPAPPPSLPGGPPPDSPDMPTGPARLAWRDSTWPAADAEGWKKPVLLKFQRTWDDAVAVAKETGRPILVCINMDGEIASEHYAGVRYRQPEIAALYEPYVAVVASVYRHNPRDHDDEGRRILCPRFGSVTCGEHIAIEPVIYEKFCEGKRIAPRHICVELDGRESYDVYYANDTTSIFRTIREGIEKRPPLPPRPTRGDRPIVERVASRDAADRAAVERAYQEGDPALRRALLDSALAHPDAAPLDLLRLAVFGLDVDASRAARRALTKVEAPEAVTLVADALRVPMDPAEREALIATLKRLGTSSPLARWLSVVHTGLAGASSAVDAKRWAETPVGATTGRPPSGPAWSGLASQYELQAKSAATRSGDPAALLDFAETSLAMAAEAPRTYPGRRGRMTARQLYGDARKAALDAERAGASGWRVHAVVALAAYHTGGFEEAYARSALAVKDLPAGDASWTSMAVLTVFAEGRWKSIKKAVKEKTDFPPEWLTDVNAAYGILLKHPLGTEVQVLWHEDLMDWLGADAASAKILEGGLARFRDSPLLHERLRERLTKRKGPGGLEAAYAAMLEGKPPSPRLLALAGVASVAAADGHRRVRRHEEALGALGRAIALFERASSGDPEARDAIDSAVALALAGRARVHLQLGRLDDAHADMLASLERDSSVAGTKDGVGITPGETAQSILGRLRAGGHEKQAATLETKLAQVDPELLRPEGE